MVCRVLVCGYMMPLLWCSWLADLGNSVCNIHIKSAGAIVNIPQNYSTVGVKVHCTERMSLLVMIIWASSVANTAAYNSKRGTVWAENGANLDLPMTNLMWHWPSLSVTLRYATAAIAIVEASENTHNSCLSLWQCNRNKRSLNVETLESNEWFSPFSPLYLPICW